jgi:DNA-binding XRE family transcriptional regulator
VLNTYELIDFQSTWAPLSRGLESGKNHGTLRMLDPAQIRAARALLGWRQEDLSKVAGVGTATIQRIEKGDRPKVGYVSTMVRIESAFEDAGVLFISDDDTGGFGLRLAKKKRKR